MVLSSVAKFWKFSTAPSPQTVAASAARPVEHSDRGGHFRWPGWLSRIPRANLVRSMSLEAFSPDNAACEGLFGRMKDELIYARDWLNTAIDEGCRMKITMARATAAAVMVCRTGPCDDT